jgi:hypothetical protein
LWSVLITFSVQICDDLKATHKTTVAGPLELVFSIFSDDASVGYCYQ